MKQSSLVLNLCLLTTTVVAASSASSHGGGGGGGKVLRVCNRGYCYNKKEESWTKRNSPPSLSQKHPASSASGEVDEGLLAVLGAASFEADYEAIECLHCPTMEDDDNDQQQPNETYYMEFEILDGDDLDERRSWREEPKRGRCMDKDLGVMYACNLIEVLDEGSLLIEDLRDGGHFVHPQPKSDFSNNKKNLKRHHHIRDDPSPPSVVVTGEDPNEDFRTVVELNMMGI